MRILIIGGSGQTGQLVIDEALKRGHTVTALVRSATSLAPRDGLTLILGTPTTQADVDAAFSATTSESDNDQPSAVIVTLKARRISETSTLMTDSVVNALNSMRQRGVRKLVVMQAQGTGRSWGSVNVLVRAFFAHSSMKLEFKDHNSVEKVVREAAEAQGDGGVDYVLARPVMLVDGDARPVRVLPEDGSGAGTLPRISRKSVAAFLVDAAESNTHDGTAPVICN